MKNILLITLACSLLGGCVAQSLDVPVQPPTGGLFTQIKAPLGLEFEPGRADKAGSASTQYINIPIFGSWSFSWGDGSVDAAAEQGGLTEINYSDYEYMSVLGIYARYTTRVYGN